MNDLEGLVLSIHNAAKQLGDYSDRLKRVKNALADVVELQRGLEEMHTKSVDVIIRSFHSKTTLDDRNWAANMINMYSKLKEAQVLASQDEYDRLKELIQIAETDLSYSRAALKGYLSIPITIAFVEKNF